MGRLTLNVLLSFAQFEREVIGERIRDKVAASKKNEREAKTIRYIFDRYLELGTIALLKEDLGAKGMTGKSWISSTGRKHTGKLCSRGALYCLLSNPIYAG